MPVNFSLESKPSKIDGTGSYALEQIPARRKLGTMDGEIITLKEARKRASKVKRIAMVEFGNGYALDASADATGLKYINHGCDPNTYMRVAYNHVEFYALRNIKRGEELTCNYGPTHHDGKLKCQCGAANCKGYL